MKNFFVLFALCAIVGCTRPETASPGNDPRLPEGTEELAVSVDQALEQLYGMMNFLYGSGTRAASRTVSAVEVYRPGQASPATRSTGILDPLPGQPGTTIPLPGSAYYVIGFEEGGYSVMDANDLSASVVCITEAGSLTAAEMEEIEQRLKQPMKPLDSLRWLSYEQIHNLGFGEEGNPEPFDINDYCDDPDEGEAPEEDLGEYILSPAGGEDFAKELIVDYLLWRPTEQLFPDEEGEIEHLPPGYKPPGGGGSVKYTYTYNYYPWDFVDGARVGPLLSTQWGQDWPFNAYCSYLDSNFTTGYYPAGCVAIALAQIIAFNERPATSFFYSTSSWTELKAHNYESAADPQGLRVQDDMGHIIRQIGNGVSMDYGVSGSSSNIGKAKRYLKNLGYRDVEKKGTKKENHIKNMLSRGLPVYIKGRTGNNEGHAWVIDGVVMQERHVETIRNDGVLCKTTIETRRLYHCNFGWRKGVGSGYYFYDMFNTKNGPVDTDPGINEGGTNKYNLNNKIKILKYTR